LGECPLPDDQLHLDDRQLPRRCRACPAAVTAGWVDLSRGDPQLHHPDDSLHRQPAIEPDDCQKAIARHHHRQMDDLLPRKGAPKVWKALGLRCSTVAEMDARPLRRKAARRRFHPMDVRCCRHPKDGTPHFLHLRTVARHYRHLHRRVANSCPLLPKGANSLRRPTDVNSLRHHRRTGGKNFLLHHRHRRAHRHRPRHDHLRGRMRSHFRRARQTRSLPLTSPEFGNAWLVSFHATDFDATDARLWVTVESSIV
jgi:hypothetical protein